MRNEEKSRVSVCVCVCEEKNEKWNEKCNLILIDDARV